jgi:hypothetical protein
MIKTRKRKGWPVGVSDTGLQDLWRALVRKNCHGNCAFSGHVYEDDPGCDGPRECHHIVKRSRLHLRYSATNGILLCKRHHDLSPLRVWRKRIEATLSFDEQEWLDGMEKKLLPDYLAEQRQTRGEFLLSQKKLLTALLDGAGEGE